MTRIGMADSEALKQVAAGDLDAFGLLVDRYKDSLVNYLTHVVRSREHAEEIAQEAFVRLYRNAEKYKDLEKVAPHLFRIATNQAISDLRRQKRWSLLMPRLVATADRESVRPDAAILTSEVQRKVREALEALPVTFRAPLALYEIEEWSYEDIARALDCRVGTVKSRIFRARELMRQQLSQWWNGERDERQRAWRSAEDVAARDGVATLQI